MRAIVVGWFSFTSGTATAGDLLACEVVCSWLTQGGVRYEIAVAPPFVGGISYQDLNPRDFTHAIFVCGPFGGGALDAGFLRRFSHCRLVGLDLSMSHTRAEWNPFDLLIERDTPATAKPDLVFVSERPLVPVVGLCLVERYGSADTAGAERALRQLLRDRELAVLEIDTRLDDNRLGMRTPAEVESLVARVDVMLTTRLHGMVMALKHGVPVIAIDPEPGGAKIMRQARAVRWPFAWPVDSVDQGVLGRALDDCLTTAGRAEARDAGLRALPLVNSIREELFRSLQPGGEVEIRFAERRRAGVLTARNRPPRQATPTKSAAERVRSALRPLKRMARIAAEATFGVELMRPRQRIASVVMRRMDDFGLVARNEGRLNPSASKPEVSTE